MKKLSIFILSLICLKFAGFNIQAQEKDSVVLKKAVQKVQDLNLMRDYEAASDFARKYLEKYPESLELKAWFIISLARTEDNELALEIAKDWIKEKGENFWTLLALNQVQVYFEREKADETAKKLIELEPNNEEAIFAYNNYLFRNNKNQESLKWLEENQSKVKKRQYFLTIKAVIVYYIEKEKTDKKNVQAAFDLFEKAIKLNPNSTNTNYLYGWYLAADKQFNKSLKFLKKATDLSPNPMEIFSRYWTAIVRRSDKTNLQNKKALEKVVAEYLAKNRNNPNVLVNVWDKYRDSTYWLKESDPQDVKKRDALEKQILSKYPNTKYDEFLAFMKIQRAHGKFFTEKEQSKYEEILLKRKAKRTAEETKFFEEYQEREKKYQSEQIALQRDYIKRPKHFNKGRLGTIYLKLFNLLANQKDSSDEEISELLKGIIEYKKNYYGNIYTEIAAKLLQRQKAQPISIIAKEAEKYARLGIEEAEKKVSLLPKDSNISKSYELKLNPTNVLADVLITNGQLTDVEKLLQNASEMKDISGEQDFDLKQENNYTDLLWGKFYTTKKDWKKAEEYFLRSAVEDEDLGLTTFQDFYEKQSGKKEGFDEYFTGILEKIKLKAKEKTLQTRIKEPKEIIPFSLKTIENELVSSADLKGKVVVINIWGVWCGPCVAEMPEIQKLFEKYKEDKDVAILTIDDGDELAKVKKFIEDKKYTLPVLMSDGYINKTPQFSNGGVFPTTLFVDKNSKVSFLVFGSTSDLVENFSWRIDALKEDN